MNENIKLLGVLVLPAGYYAGSTKSAVKEGSWISGRKLSGHLCQWFNNENLDD